MKKILLFGFLILLFGCKTNQKINGKKVGKWIYTDTLNDITYKTTGRYKNDLEVGKWKYLANKKTIKTELYKKDICFVTTYHSNGNIESKGKTKLTIKDSLAHWFYFDEWKFYDQNKKLLETKFYSNSELIKDSIY